jgi:hypothetical protein
VDPNAALETARNAQDDYLRAASRHVEALGADDETKHAANALRAADRLSEAFTALDGWLIGGGFLPEVWRDAQQGFAERVPERS